MTPLLWLTGLRYHLRHRGQLLLSILGIAVGVAVVVAVDLANESARRSFSLSMESLSGRATHRIVAGPLGVEQSLYADLRRSGVWPAAPVVEGFIQAGGRTFHLLGLDPFAEQPFRPELGIGGGSSIDVRALLSRPGAVALDRSVATAMGLSVGDSFTGRAGGHAVRLTVAGLLESEGRLQRVARAGVLVADIATAQELLGMGSHISHIDLIAREPAALDAIAARLPPQVRIEAAGARAGVMAQMTRAFSINLTALSLLALLVGLFLIYNTMTFSVVQRQSLLGTLRLLGTSRRELFALVCVESLVIGGVGTLFGIAGGIALAGGLLHLVTRTINDLYFVLNVTELFVAPAGLAKGLLLGLFAATGAALAPAAAAARVPPGWMMLRSRAERSGRSAYRRAAAIGAATAAIGAALLLPESQSLVVGFAALFLLVVGFALAIPLLTAGAARGAVRAAGRRLGTTGRLALRGIDAGLSRTGVAVAALTVAISVGTGVGIMVDSFRTTVQQWLGYTLQADIYVSPPAAVSAQRSTPLDPGVPQRVRQTPGVSHLSSIRGIEVRTGTGPARLQVVQLAPESRDGYRFKAGDPDRIWPAFAAGAVLISEPYAARTGAGVGDAISLQTDRGMRPFPVAGVFYDYESDRGAIEMARATYQRWFEDRAVSGIGVYLEPGAEPEQVLAALRERLAGVQSLNIRSNRELREASLAIFDRTFTITEVLRLLSLVVAFIGVFSALMALQLEKAREFAILRATGMTPGELLRLVVGQTGLMGLAAGLFALPLGLLLAVVLIEVINRRAFGWTLWLQVPADALIQSLLLAVIAALLAGLYPALRLAHTPPAAALREE